MTLLFCFDDIFFSSVFLIIFLSMFLSVWCCDYYHFILLNIYNNNQFCFCSFFVRPFVFLSVCLLRFSFVFVDLFVFPYLFSNKNRCDVLAWGHKEFFCRIFGKKVSWYLTLLQSSRDQMQWSKLRASLRNPVATGKIKKIKTSNTHCTHFILSI